MYFGHFLFLRFIYVYFVCMSVLPPRIYIHRDMLHTHRGQKRASEPLEQKFSTCGSWGGAVSGILYIGYLQDDSWLGVSTWGNCAALKQSDRWLWTVLWVLGTKSRSPVRAANVINQGTLSPALLLILEKRKLFSKLFLIRGEKFAWDHIPRTRWSLARAAGF